MPYSLGNIIVHWFYRCNVKEEEHANSEPYIETEAGELTGGSNNDETFGQFLKSTVPFRLLVHVPPRFRETRWWFLSYERILDVIDPITESLRFALHEFASRRGLVKDDNDLDTCVIHLRLGDFFQFTGGFIVSPLDVIRALSKLPRIPKHFEILNSGLFHNTDAIMQSMTTQTLSLLEDTLTAMYPDATVHFIRDTSVDDDFYRAVNAPMLVTGLGSFAMTAAIANRNFRLTPALSKLNQDATRDHRVAERKVSEGWYTYEIA